MYINHQRGTENTAKTTNTTRNLETWQHEPNRIQWLNVELKKDRHILFDIWNPLCSHGNYKFRDNSRPLMSQSRDKRTVYCL